MRAQLNKDWLPIDYSEKEQISRIFLSARDIRRGFTLYVWLP